MRVVKALSFLTFVAAACAAGWFGFVSYRQAEAHDLSGVIAEEAPPAPPSPQVEARPIDGRIASYKDRGDGARLVWQPGEGETLLRAGFVDNGSLVVSATSASAWKLFGLDLPSGKTAPKLESAARTVASSHRPAHKNAGALCYSQLTEGRKDEAWCADLAGQKAKRLTTHDGDEDIIEVSISPDGNWALFEVNVDRATAGKKEPARSSVWKIGLNGANLQQLTRGGDDRFPTWSEDGRRIFFQRRLPDGGWDPYVMFADGTNPGPILRTYDESETWPSKRPGAEEVVFAAQSGDAPPRLKRMDLETKSGAWITSGAYGPETRPAVSPDGKLVAFLAPVDPAVPARLGLWIVQIDR